MKMIGVLTAGVLLAAPVTGGVASIAAEPAKATTTTPQIVVQTVMDERAKKSTGNAKVWAPSLENLDVELKGNKTIVTKVGSSTVIASRNSPYPRKAFSLKPGTYRFKTTIKYQTPTYLNEDVVWSSTQTISRTQRVKVLKPATGTCIYMVKNGDEVGKPGDEFMVWHKVGRSIHGVLGGFQSEGADLRLKLNTRRTKASGTIFTYPTGSHATSVKVKGKNTKSYTAKGWTRVNTSTWKNQFPRKFTPHC